MKRPQWKPHPGPQARFFEDDEHYQTAGAAYSLQQGLLNAHHWAYGNTSDQVEVEQLEEKLARFSPAFYFWARFWVIVVAALIAVILFQLHTHRGHTMSNPKHGTPAPAAQPESEPSNKPLAVTINRFANAVINMATHPDTGMFFFDAQDLTVNEKLDTLKIRALVDSLCASGVLDRASYENRLEVLVGDAAQKLEDGAKRLAFGAVFDRKLMNGSDHR